MHIDFSEGNSNIQVWFYKSFLLIQQLEHVIAGTQKLAFYSHNFKINFFQTPVEYLHRNPI